MCRSMGSTGFGSGVIGSLVWDDTGIPSLTWPTVGGFDSVGASGLITCGSVGRVGDLISSMFLLSANYLCLYANKYIRYGLSLRLYECIDRPLDTR